MIRYGSVCSGIESASVAWEPLGLSPAWFAEIEKFPAAVLAHHWPEVVNHGDMCALPDKVAAGELEAPDILVGGTPCQAFSVAGKRGGLDDDRGQLTIEFVRLANEIDKRRTGSECVVVWENVPGVLSMRDNAFGCFLGELVGETCPVQPPGDKWKNAGVVYGPQRAAAWRILDAQYFGVAQRRRRVFVVASARAGFDPSKVLFESEGMRRDSAPSREAGASVAALTAAGVGTCGADDNQAQAGHIVTGLNAKDDPVSAEQTAMPLQTDAGGSVIHAIPIHDKATRHAGKTGKGSGNGLGVGSSTDPATTLTTGDKHAVAAFAENQQGEVRFVGGDGQTTNALSSGGGKPGQGYPAIYFRKQAHGKYILSDHAATIAARDFKSSTDLAVEPLRHLKSGAVRRLTPRECERLQGFPDDHTQIPWRNKTPEKCPDGPRYKAIGNSKAVPVVRWLGRRVLAELNGELS